MVMSFSQDEPEDEGTGEIPGLSSITTEYPTSLDMPVIGILASGTNEAARHGTSVRRSGGKPLEMTGGDEALDRVEGLVLTSAPPSDGIRRAVNKDAEGFALRALEIGIPILATGGGFLTLNCALGGSMVEVDGHASEPGNCEEPAYHRIYIAPGGKLASVVGSGGFVRVNSRHTFGVREAQKAPGLLATAYSLEDGVIEALEIPEHPWAIGVQFDPQRRGELPPHFDRLFDSLVAQALRR